MNVETTELIFGIFGVLYSLCTIITTYNNGPLRKTVNVLRRTSGLLCVMTLIMLISHILIKKENPLSWFILFSVLSGMLVCSMVLLERVTMLHNKRYQ